MAKSAAGPRYGTPRNRDSDSSQHCAGTLKLDGVEARMVREEAVSTLLGYTSIACWLGAQFPQLVVNWRRKSVDGLALPFLINWFFGDATNLIGCLLTDQLPFQTYVATYFVLVDASLIIQYFHYDAAKDARSLSALRSHSRTSLLIHSPPLPYSPLTHTLPHADLTRSRSRSYSMDAHLRAAVANMSRATTELEVRHADSHASEVDIPDTRARWRSVGARRAGSLEGLPESVVADPHNWEWAGRWDHRESDAAADAVDIESESTPSIMVDSFHSEGGGRGRGKDKHVSWDTVASGDRRFLDRRLSNDPPLPEPSGIAPSTVRGRQMTRPALSDSPTAVEAPFTRARTTSTASTVSAAASRRSAGIVFLGVFALFGLGTHAGYRLRRDVSLQGVVLTAPPTYIPFDAHSSSDSSSGSEPVSVTFSSAQPAHVSSSGDTKLLIGRISAWTCTTLYITSRLPQIWKNFARKSVEGLSMYLFTFAFLGNFFYVLSILTSPKMDLPPPQAAQFLRSSIPYLLGSGGTLMFDVTIVLQSFVYAKQPPVHTRRRRKSLVSATVEEERALLEADAAN